MADEKKTCVNCGNMEIDGESARCGAGCPDFTVRLMSGKAVITDCGAWKEKE